MAQTMLLLSLLRANDAARLEGTIESSLSITPLYVRTHTHTHNHGNSGISSSPVEERNVDLTKLKVVFNTFIELELYQ